MSQPPPSPARPPRLLVVEDDRATHDALRRIFTRRGWEVLLATTCAEARALLGAGPDCVILDLMLPDGDGAELLQQIRDRGLPIRVAVTTGCCDAHRLRTVEALGPEGLLFKPVSLCDLDRVLGDAS